MIGEYVTNSCVTLISYQPLTLQNNKVLDWSKLRAFADDKNNVT